MVNPRLVRSLHDEGSYCDDELMAEYLGGVLAAGRSPSGRDDRAVSWSNLITSMSALQLRTHFIFYREWAHALHGRSDIEFSQDRDAAQMYVDLADIIPVLKETVPDIDHDAMMAPIISGLLRMDLIESRCDYGRAVEMRSTGSVPSDLPFIFACRVTPSIAGMELYGWACGLTGITPAQFVAAPEVLEIEADIKRPKVVLPNISPK